MYIVLYNRFYGASVAKIMLILVMVQKIGWQGSQLVSSVVSMSCLMLLIFCEGILDTLSGRFHYNDVIVNSLAFQITSLTIVTQAFI